nr:DUF3443 domain-containing protein [Paraburkholderia sp. J7]
MYIHHIRIWPLRMFGVIAVAALLAACGGGSPSESDDAASSNALNQVTVSVGAGVANVVNMPTVSVTICAPGTSNCQTVDKVLVDTGSFGLRIVSSAVSNVLSNLQTTTVNGGKALAECGQFVSSYTWGSVRTADVKIGGETASHVPIQTIGDLGTSDVPPSCSDGGSSANTAASLGANGILGIGPAAYDCGSVCTTSTIYSNYYSCSNGNASCESTTAALSEQVANPVRHFPIDNNGVIVTMNNSSGGSSVGTLTFGIGTRSNNTRSSGAALLTTTAAGDVTGIFLGRAIGSAFFDTGSNAYFFDAGANTPSNVDLTVCSDNSAFYCPATDQSLTATLVGANGTQANVPFTVRNADTLFGSGRYAIDNLAGPFGNSLILDLGLPHFYGRTLYFGMDLRASSDSTSGTPYVAF